MNETINIFELKVFQGMAATYIIHNLFSKEEIAHAMNYFIDEEYGMMLDNMERLEEELQQEILYKFHNWFLQLDMCAERLLKAITKIPSVDVQVSRH